MRDFVAIDIETALVKRWSICQLLIHFQNVTMQDSMRLPVQKYT